MHQAKGRAVSAAAVPGRAGGARGLRAGGAAAVVALLVGCTAPPAAAPGPVDVRVTDMDADVADAIATQVANKLVERGLAVAAAPQRGTRAAAAPAPATPPHATDRPAARAGRLLTAWEPARVREARRVDFGPAPAPADADPAILREGAGLALDWLARTQEPDGSWLGDAAPQHRIGLTGLAVLCFVGGGSTHASGPHHEAVARAMKYLQGHQDPEGCIGTRANQHFMYGHGFAALALVELYAASSSPIVRTSSQRAVDFVLRAQNPYLGWRYGVRDGDNDTEVTGLMITVIGAARAAGLEVDSGAFRGGLAWFDKMTDPETGRVGYQQRGGPTARTIEAVDRFPADRSEATTAVATAARLIAGPDPKVEPWVRKGIDLLSATPPLWDTEQGTIDLYYWYWGTMAMSLDARTSRAGGLPDDGGAAWQAWRSRLVRALGPNQRRDAGSDLLGSWDPVDAWSREGGRVYATAMACLAAQHVAGTAERPR